MRRTLTITKSLNFSSTHVYLLRRSHGKQQQEQHSFREYLMRTLRAEEESMTDDRKMIDEYTKGYFIKEVFVSDFFS